MKRAKLARGSFWVVAFGSAGLACASSAPPPAASAAATPAAPAPGTAGAPPQVSGGPRSPQAILADAVAATGGAAAWNAHKSAHYQIETVFQGMGMGGTGERFATREGKSFTVTQMTGVGTVREGTDGKVFWSEDPIQGLRFLEGAEREQARIEAAWNPDMQADQLYAKLESATEAGPNGVTYECVVATPKVGPPVKSCYDPVTHLQVTQSGTRATPQGDIPFRGITKDWRDVSGLKVPFGAETQLGPITLVVTVKSLVFDEPVDAKMFEPPAH